MRTVGSKQPMCGSSLVEMLVAMLILSVGLLGIASLLLRDLGNTRAAFLRTQAVGLVSDMAGRIRANAGGGNDYDLATYGDVPSPHGCAPANPGSSGNCSNAQLAEDDLARWQSAVQRTLPAAPAGVRAANVQFLGGDPARYRIGVAWQEPGEMLPFSFESELLVQVSP